jgi:transcriptional regulator with XRE-family HTH domain
MAKAAERSERDSSSPKDVGRHLREVRKQQGLSRGVVARSAGLTRRELAAYERGRVEVPESDLWCLAGSCGVEVSELLPRRDALAISPDLTSLGVGDTIRHLREPAQPDGLLRQYLPMIYELRNLPPGSRIPLRQQDLAALADALGGTPECIETRLTALIGASPDEAARLRSMILPPASLPATASAPTSAQTPADPYAALTNGDVPRAVEEFFAAPGPVDPFAAPGSTAPPPAPNVAAEPASAPPGPAMPSPPMPEASPFPMPPATTEPPWVDATMAPEAFAPPAHAPMPPSPAFGAPPSATPFPPPAEAAPEFAPPSVAPVAPPTETAAAFAPPAPGAPFEPIAPPTPAVAPPMEAAAAFATPTPGAPFDPIAPPTPVVTPPPLPTTPFPPAADAGPMPPAPDPAVVEALLAPPAGPPNGTVPAADPMVAASASDPFSGPVDAQVTAAAQRRDPFAAPSAIDPLAPPPLPPDPFAVPPAASPNGTDTSDPTPAPADPGVVLDDPFAPPQPSNGAPHDAGLGITVLDAIVVDDPVAPPRPGDEARSASGDADDVLTPGSSVAPPTEPPHPPITWNATVVGTPEPGPEPTPPPSGSPRFERASTKWQVGGIFPATAIADDGTLALRRADTRWALTDLSAPGDCIVEAAVDFRAGSGFGLIFRGSVDQGERITGYSFDVDPIAGGGGYLVRLWEGSKQHWRPLAQAPVTDPALLYGRHVVALTLRADQLTVLVDGDPVLEIPALSRWTVELGREPAHGDRVGVQAWSTTEVTIESFRVANP